jgi:predicted HTH domain antitoxin
MQITVNIPDDLVQRLDQSAESLSRQLLEMVVAHAYHTGKISTAEVRQLLQLPTRLEAHAFLQRMGVYLNYDTPELAQDLQTLQLLRMP